MLLSRDQAARLGPNFEIAERDCVNGPVAALRLVLRTQPRSPK